MTDNPQDPIHNQVVAQLILNAPSVVLTTEIAVAQDELDRRHEGGPFARILFMGNVGFQDGTIGGAAASLVYVDHAIAAQLRQLCDDFLTGRIETTGTDAYRQNPPSN